MLIQEILAGQPLMCEIAFGQTDNPGPGTSTPLVTIAAPGAVPPVVDQEFTPTGLKSLHRLKHLKRGAIKD